MYCLGTLCQIQSMMTEEGTKHKMESLGARIASCKSIVEAKVSSWTSAERQVFFVDFSDSPVVSRLNEVGSDPVRRLSAMMDLSEEDLEGLMTLQACVAMEAESGTPLQQPSGKTAAGGSSGVGGLLGGLVTGLGALTGLGGGGQASAHQHGPNCQHDHGHAHGGHSGHDHSHGHSHGHSHEHHGQAAASGSRSSASQTMDR